MIQIAQKQPEPIKNLCPDLPAGVRQIIQKLLQKSPDKRFQTGADLATALGKELSSLYDQQVEQKKHKYIPLKIRWTLSVGAIVGLVSFISINIVFNMQSSAMTKQAVDSGASFAKFISTETAIPILSEDWITLDSFIGDAASRDTFSYLIVTDRAGIVRGASDSSLVGEAYQPDQNAELISQTEDVYTTSSETADGRKMFNIKTPILFQSTEVGQIILGLSQDGLDEVKSITGWLMFLLALITTSSVAVVMFIFGGLISRPFKVLNQSLNSFAAGNLDTRISLTRNDEIGEVFDGFNSMAAAIQDRYTEVTDELAQTGINDVVVLDESQNVTKVVDQPTDEPNNQQEPSKTEVVAEVEPLEEENPDQTIISSSQIDLDTQPKDASQNKQQNDQAATADSIPESQSNPDQTIIATSQISVDKKAESDVDKDQTANETQPSDAAAETDLNPDQTIISTSQIGIETKVDEELNPDQTIISSSQINTPKEPAKDKKPKSATAKPTTAKKPAVKRKPRKKVVKATETTDKKSTKKDDEPLTDTDKSIKN